MSSIEWLNIFALCWMLFCWIGYSRFARVMAKRSDSLSSVLHRYRFAWMKEMLDREQRISDAALISNIERNVTFLASTSILVLAGLLTAFTATDKLYNVLSALPFYAPTTITLIQSKLVVLICIYVYTFFTFTWSMRQYGFASVLIGAAPAPDVIKNDAALANEYIRSAGKVIDLASHAYNYGLRAYYFSLSVIGWFINPWVFILFTTLVVAVLYFREFRSRSLAVLLASSNIGNTHNNSGP